jgi:diguanylate cyclase (GGDEF)-like protein
VVNARCESETAPRVLIVDGDSKSRAQLERIARDAYMHVYVAADEADAIDAARSGRFDVAIVEIATGRAGDALATARALRALPGNERLPLAFMASDADFERRVAAAHAGGSLFLSKPIDPYVFVTTVQQLVALRHAERSRVLLLDDDSDFVESVAAVLETEGIAVRAVSDPARILDALDAEKPDLILLDVMLPKVSGFDLARMLRSAPEWQSVPILFLTGRSDVESRVSAFDAGGDDYLVKPVLPEELVARVRVRLERRKLEREIIEKDPLTKLLSRRALLEALAQRVSEARRHGGVLSVALLDVDRFKGVNDAHGHLAGDRVLATLGRLLNERFRLEDLRARWGGEEFVVVFPGATVDTAAAVLRRVLVEFTRIRFRGDPDRGGAEFGVTFSAGVASFPDDGSSVDALLRAADSRLYEAKAAGRSRVISWRDMDRDETTLRH